VFARRQKVPSTCSGQRMVMSLQHFMSWELQGCILLALDTLDLGLARLFDRRWEASAKTDEQKLWSWPQLSAIGRVNKSNNNNNNKFGVRHPGVYPPEVATVKVFLSCAICVLRHYSQVRSFCRTLCWSKTLKWGGKWNLVMYFNLGLSWDG
jgi:hypothetical protein